MYVPESLLDKLIGKLALNVKQLFEQARQALRKKGQPKKRRRRRQPAASRAAKVLAKKRWAAKYRYPKVPVQTSYKLH